MQQPKPFLNRLRLRNHAIGVERRRNISKMILERGTPFPKPIKYEDIDQAFFNWVDKTLDISYMGKRLPTYRLFSTQKISEYSQTWQNLDETGNLVVNFKTITRENNPQHGESQGSSYNIPGHRDYPIFYVPVLQENGEEAYDMYSIKQPFAVNFIYTVNFVCNKYELLNKFNELINYTFSGLECYIAPNDHPMPMFLDGINDESEYTIDDRKFYSQTYIIKLMGYIIREEDMKVTHLPSRLVMRFLETEDRFGDNKRSIEKRNSGDDLTPSYSLSEMETSNKKRSKNVEAENKVFNLDYLGKCDILDPVDITKKKPTVVLKEEELPDACCVENDESDDKFYYNKIIKVIINIPDCEKNVIFYMDNDMVLTSVETSNVYDFKLFINDEYADLEWDIKFIDGDKVEVKVSRDDEYLPTSLTLVGYDPNIVFDKRTDPESELDVVPDEEDIIINGDNDN